jgi:serine/threonine protein phosphatase PrpC
MKFSIYQGSRQGARPYNQDRLAYSYSKEALLMVIADGMGGHRHGEIAAQLAVKMLTEAFQKAALPILKNPAEFLSNQIQQVHDAIDNVRETHQLLESPRTTIVVALIQHNQLYTAHLGDSRLYHFRKQKLLYRTEDHSVVQVLYRKGHLDEQAMLTHPDRHKVYNCVGGDRPPQIDLSHKRDLRNGDLLLLCTDGLWGAMSDADISKILHAGSVSKSVPALLDMAEVLSGPEGDNISAIALMLGDSQSNPDTISTGTMPLDATTTIINPTMYGTAMQDQNAATTDLSDDEIERAIAEIQTAINKTNR